MNRNHKFLAIMLIVILPLLTGCFFKKGANPVAVSPVADTQLKAQVVAGEQPQIMASSYAKPLQQRKYTFSKCGHKFNGYRLREGVKKAAASLRISLMGANTTDNIFITFEQMKVKRQGGPATNISVESRRVDLLSASQLSEVLADINLEEGIYNQMDFWVKEAEIVENGKTSKMIVPSRKIRFRGKFEIKEGYSTLLKIKFMHRVIKFKFLGKRFYIMIPVVRISSELVLKDIPEETEGGIAGLVKNLVSLENLAGINMALEGTSFSTQTAADGSFRFDNVPVGLYTLKAIHPDYLDYSFPVEVLGGRDVDTEIQLNPAVINSTVGNTGWFSKYYPFADANAEFGEVALETPVNIDFVSLAFVKAEVKFTGVYQAPGSARFRSYLASTQQVSAEHDLGGWWAGNTAALGNNLGDFYATPEPGTEYVVDVTELIRSNPASSYFLACQNMDLVNIKMTNIQLSIFYR